MFINRERRMQQEQQLQTLKGFVKQNNLDRDKNLWFQRQNQQQGYIAKQSTAQLLQKRKQHLLERRQKLKKLLQEEEVLYKGELLGLTKTPEQVREEMRERVEVLRAKSTLERQEEVARLLDLQFRNNADELRLIGQKANEMKVQIEREIQMLEKRRKSDQRLREDKIYSELVDQEIKEKVLKERELREQYYRKVQERNQILAEQIREITEKRRRDLELAEEENAHFKEQCATLLLDERRKAEQQKELNRRLAEEVRAFNDFQQRQKEEQADRERQLDKKMLQEEIEREEVLRQLELAQREKFKREAHEFFQAIRTRAKEMQANQQLIERLIAEEVERQFRKQQEVWDREERARRRLMEEVYTHRFDQIEDKKKVRELVRLEKEKEKWEVGQQFSQFQKEEKDLLMDELRKMKLYHEQIMRQVQEKYELKKKDLFREMEEERKRSVAELEYRQKVEKAMKEGELLIENIKRLRDQKNSE